MKRIAKFEKVIFEQYKKDFPHIPTMLLEDKDIEEFYNNIKLPARATAGSAGYDFFAPTKFTLEPGGTVKIPTGIRVQIQEGWVLQIYPRSSLGFKYKLQLDNTAGIIDSDYYHSNNEGHIWIKMTNNGDKVIELKQGDAFAQGIFLLFGVTKDDNVTEVRNGGFGSTNKK